MRGIRRAVEAASGRAARRCADRRRCRASAERRGPCPAPVAARGVSRVTAGRSLAPRERSACARSGERSRPHPAEPLAGAPTGADAAQARSDRCPCPAPVAARGVSRVTAGRSLAPRERSTCARSGERSRPHPAEPLAGAPTGADAAQARSDGYERAVRSSWATRSTSASVISAKIGRASTSLEALSACGKEPFRYPRPAKHSWRWSGTG